MRRAFAGAVMFAVWGAACSTSSSAPDRGVTALYDGPARLDPFPSDRFTRPDPSSRTGLRVSVGAVADDNPYVRAYPTTRPALEARDGFSTAGGIFVRFSDDIDAESVAARPPAELAQLGTPVALVDVDPSSPAQGTAVPLVAKYFSSNEDTRAIDPDFMLLLEPAVPLAPRRKYTFVVSDALRAKSGAPVRASAATKALVSGDAEGAYGAALRATLPIVERASGIAREHVALATSFTTASVHDDLVGVAKDVRESPPPAAVRAPVLEKRATDAGDTRARFLGSFTAPEYRAPKPVGTWSVVDGKPQKRADAELEYVLAFTNATRSGPRPVVVLGHGLGRDKDQTWEVAQYLASLDVVVVGMDAPEHGSRHDPPYPPGQTDMVVATLSFVGVNLDQHAIDVGVSRDNFRQLMSDQLHLLRFLSTLGSVDVLPVGAPDGVPDIDPTRVLYLGVSFGAVVGSTVLSLVPDVRSACLTVGGAPLGAILRESTTLRLLVKSIEPEGATDALFARFTTIAQGIIDPGDPINFAPYVTTRRLEGAPERRGTDVLLQEAIDDAIIPNLATESLARALGLTQLTPVLHPLRGVASVAPPLASTGDAPVAAIAQFDRTDGQPANHRTFFGTMEPRRQYVEFFRTALSASRPTVPSAYP